MRNPKSPAGKPPARARLARTTKAQAAQSSARFMTSREKKRAAKGSESLIRSSPENK